MELRRLRFRSVADPTTTPDPHFQIPIETSELTAADDQVSKSRASPSSSVNVLNEEHPIGRRRSDTSKMTGMSHVNIALGADESRSDQNRARSARSDTDCLSYLATTAWRSLRLTKPLRWRSLSLIRGPLKSAPQVAIPRLTAVLVASFEPVHISRPFVASLRGDIDVVVGTVQHV